MKLARERARRKGCPFSHDFFYLYDYCFHRWCTVGRRNPLQIGGSFKSFKLSVRSDDRTSRRRPTGLLRMAKDDTNERTNARVSRGTAARGIDTHDDILHTRVLAPWRALVGTHQGQSMLQPAYERASSKLNNRRFHCAANNATHGAPQTPAGSHYCVHNRELFVIGNSPQSRRTSRVIDAAGNRAISVICRFTTLHVKEFGRERVLPSFPNKFGNALLCRIRDIRN